MFFSTIKWIIISLLLIMLIHYLYYFLKNTLTVPKVRDLMYKPQEQYNELLKNHSSPDKKFEEEMSSELKKYVEELNI